ncbi:MAG TPA: ketoacyl-synthetase C-terminal extension domain-containing protein, partial [Ruminiclostridium sp.]|nr:ketoacyl-synthetase C-terminal extension domain-containing protein [Ruminiclostridium sp.]
MNLEKGFAVWTIPLLYNGYYQTSIFFSQRNMQGDLFFVLTVLYIIIPNHKEIPPSLHFKLPNRNIDFENSPVYVNNTLIPWVDSDVPRRCGVTSFGLSGTNAHVVLEEAPVIEKSHSRPSMKFKIFTLSGFTEQALVRLVNDYIQFIKLNGNVDADDLCFTANTGRGHYAYRLALVFSELSE